MIHREREADSEMHCVSLCNFVLLSVARSKKHRNIFQTAARLTVQNGLPLTGIADEIFSPRENSV